MTATAERPALLGDALPGPLRRSLARLANVRPLEVADAAAALRQALAPVTASAWPEVAWRWSALTGTGFPVELAWGSRDAAVRWTCEVAGPETATADRLSRCAAVARLPDDLETWSRVQRGRDLRWGAWLGGRHLGPARRSKVYLEVPDEVGLPAPWSTTADRLAREVTGLGWRMAGINDDGSVELYARIPELPRRALEVAGRVVGTGSPAEVVADLLGPRPAARLPLPRPSGLSVVLAPDGEPAALTWFSFAKAGWSTDRAAAGAVARVCAPGGSVTGTPDSRDLYAALVSGADDGRWRHGMVGVGVDVAGGTWLQAGIRPT